jgi:hypothetical protein
VPLRPGNGFSKPANLLLKKPRVELRSSAHANPPDGVQSYSGYPEYRVEST